MDTKKLIHYAIILACPILTYIISAPAGLTEVGWHLAGIYVGTILAIIFKPFPLPVILLAGVAVAMVAISFSHPEMWNNPAKPGSEAVKIALKDTDALNGYKSGTTWLIFAAFAVSTAFVSTGLGKRIAYVMIGKLGSTTLRLGYVNAFLDLLLSPAMPSTTARAGGVLFPIMNSIVVSLGSDPEKSPRKAGHYLLLNTYMVVKTTGYIFLTAMAPNAMAMQLMEPILHIKFNWAQWFFAASVPGLLILLLTPLVIYVIYPPELKQVNNKEISEKGLAELGPMTKREKGLLVIFVLAVLAWALSDVIGLKDASTTAIGAMASLVIFGIIGWDDISKNKGAWNTLIWYGGILGLSSVLTKAQFFGWLAEVLRQQLGGLTISGTMVTIVVLFLSVAVRYLFASGGAYVSAMVPVFSAVGIAANADPILLALGLLFTNSYGGALTHYGAGPAPVIFGAGYHDTKSWWTMGAIVGFGSLLIHVTVGFAWWHMLAGMGVFK